MVGIRREAADMSERKLVKKVQRVVWRISAEVPAGEFVLISSRAPGCAGQADPSHAGFLASSLDLANGSVVTEADLDTLPGALVDAFLKGDP